MEPNFKYSAIIHFCCQSNRLNLKVSLKIAYIYIGLYLVHIF